MNDLLRMKIYRRETLEDELEQINKDITELQEKENELNIIKKIFDEIIETYKKTKSTIKITRKPYKILECSSFLKENLKQINGEDIHIRIRYKNTKGVNNND